MAHQRLGSRHLRNRHGSDTFSSSADDPSLLLPAGRRSIADHSSSANWDPADFASDSTYALVHSPVDHSSSSSARIHDRSNWSPSTIENGTAKPMPHPSASSLPQHLLHQPLSPPLSLPSGASTPQLESTTTRHGNPIVTFPPPAPTWRNIPNKGQLAILTSSRFVDFFQQAALQTFMVHQLKSFDPSLPDSVISHQAGVLQGAFTAAQIVSAILWGRAADQPVLGRKLVLNIGLVGTAIGCIGVAFSKTYTQAVVWRFLCGAINGTVGSARTMVAECTPKPWHARAFLLLPAAFNVANVLGPITAGLLTDPVVNFPHLFGPGSTFGGETGVGWMRDYPFACANLISTVVLLLEAVVVHFFLDETLKGKRPMELSQLDPVTLVRNFFAQLRQARRHGYRILRESTQREGLLSGQERTSVELDRVNRQGEKITEERPPQVLPFHRIWTSNVLWVLLSVAIFDFHMGAFANLWILFLATPREYIPGTETPSPSLGETLDPPQLLRPRTTPAGLHHLSTRSMFKFAAGLAFPPATIGFAMAIIGFIGVALQFLLYPYANARFGLMRCFRGSLFLFPAAYSLAPYIALLPSTSAPPDPASGWTVWIGIAFVLFLQVAARTFALPATIILINNSSPHPSVLATIHGIGQACSATFRTFGPMLAGYWYGLWTDRGIVGMAWWIVASLASLGCVASFKVRNGSGHEIFLPGEETDQKEAETGGGSGDSR